KLDPTSSLAHKAVILAAEQHIKNNDPEPLDDLDKLASSLPATSPDKADVDAALARLKPKPLAFDVDAGPKPTESKTDAKDPKTAPKKDAPKSDAKSDDADK